MTLNPEQISKLIQQALPDAVVKVQGDGYHYSAYVESASFQGKTRIQQHQLVYQALKGYVGEELHALSLHTNLPTK